jgi:hypothetical protein
VNEKERKKYRGNKNRRSEGRTEMNEEGNKGKEK